METTKLQDMGTTGLAAYVRGAKNGRAKNARRQHAERVLVARYPAHAAVVVERFREAIAA